MAGSQPSAVLEMSLVDPNSRGGVALRSPGLEVSWINPVTLSSTELQP